MAITLLTLTATRNKSTLVRPWSFWRLNNRRPCALLDGGGLSERLRDNFRRTDPSLVIEDDIDGLFWIICDGREVEIAGADEGIFVFHARFHPFEQAIPIFAPETDERKLRDAARLNESQHFEEFVERPKAARHENEGNAVFHKANFARKEIVKVHRDVREPIALLLMRQFDVETDGFSFGERCTFIGSFHYAGPATSDNGEIMLGEALREFDCGLVTG